MSIKKQNGIIDSEGNSIQFIPPEPEGDTLGGINASDVAQITQNASDVHDLQLQNLLNVNMSTLSKYGITCTNNGDGTYTFNGTATAETRFTIMSTEEFANKMPSGEYKLVGCPQGGDYQNKYCIEIWNATSSKGYRDVGDGIVFLYANGDNIAFHVLVRANTVMNNLVFKPMITRDLTATYNDFKPFNQSLVQGQEITNLNNTLASLPTAPFFVGKVTDSRVVRLPHTLGNWCCGLLVSNVGNFGNIIVHFKFIGSNSANITYIEGNSSCSLAITIQGDELIIQVGSSYTLHSIALIMA